MAPRTDATTRTEQPVPTEVALTDATATLSLNEERRSVFKPLSFVANEQGELVARIAGRVPGQPGIDIPVVVEPSQKGGDITPTQVDPARQADAAALDEKSQGGWVRRLLDVLDGEKVGMEAVKKLDAAKDERYREMISTLADLHDDLNSTLGTSKAAARWVTINGRLAVLVTNGGLVEQMLDGSGEEHASARVRPGDDSTSDAAKRRGAGESEKRGGDEETKVDGVTPADASRELGEVARRLQPPPPELRLSDEHIEALAREAMPFIIYEFSEALRGVSKNLHEGVAKESMAIVGGLAQKYCDAVRGEMERMHGAPYKLKGSRPPSMERPTEMDPETLLAVAPEIIFWWQTSLTNPEEGRRLDVTAEARRVLEYYAPIRVTEQSSMRASADNVVPFNVSKESTMNEAPRAVPAVAVA